MADPELARPDTATLELLRALAARALDLVLISGRDIDQLEQRVPVASIRLIGNHGMEERRLGRSQLSPLVEPFAANLERAEEAITALPEAAAPGLFIERKRAAISVHFRQSPGLEGDGRLKRALASVAEREGLRLHPGRFVWELRPALEINKGSVIAALAQSTNAQTVVYVGDDVTDSDAFRALRRLQDVRTLGVGVHSSEVPAEIFKECDLVVDGVEGVKAFLSDLLAIG